MPSEQVGLPDIETLRMLDGVKWTRHGPDVIPAWVADMDIRPPAAVLDTLTALIDRRDFGYNFHARDQLPEAFAAWQHDHHGWNPDPGRVRLFCDILHGIDTVLWHHTAPGDGVVLLTPVYPPFLKALEQSGRRLVDVPLDPDGWRLDRDRLAAAIDDGTTAMLICNPHNPTGRVFDADELDAIAQVAADHDLLVLMDEVWGDLVHPGATHVPLALHDTEAARRTITFSSASKTFNLAGLRCAVAHVGSDVVANALDALPMHLTGAVGTPGAEATLAAWSDTSGWLDDLRRHLGDRRDQAIGRLRAEWPNVGVQSPEATYLLWLDLRQSGLGDDPAATILDKGRLALSPGPDFGLRGLGFARLNVATSAEVLDLVLDRLGDALGN
ncbi:MAG: aminotransferase class I/II-fold pyridoxal phosphate-dependent enzyme [Actinomycetota bacterium]